MIKDRILALFGTSLLVALVILSGRYAMTVIRSSAAPNASSELRLDAQDASKASATQMEDQRERPMIYYEAIFDRPIFAPTRRKIFAQQEQPEEPVVETNTQEATVQPDLNTDLVLSGVMGAAGNLSAYIIVDGQEGLWLSVDDQIEGWTLTDIGPNEVDLEARGRTYRLDLFQ